MNSSHYEELPTINVRPIVWADSPEWQSMRCDLWPEGAHEHAQEIQAFFDGRLEEPIAVFVAEAASKIVGVAELAIRSELPGIASERIGYVEGLYVKPQYRGMGVARTLLMASRAWAQDQRCTAFASDRAGRVVIDTSFRPA